MSPVPTARATILWVPCAVACALSGSAPYDILLQPSCFFAEIDILCRENPAVWPVLCFACKISDGCGCVQENPRSQAAIEGKQWDGPCNERLIGQLLADLKGWGVELESLKPSDLFDIIRGRTLW